MDIRFIDSRYNELFRIPDGGCIKINLNNGEKLLGKCKYIDDYHFTMTQAGRMYGDTYHIRQFAEINEHKGNTVEPAEESEYLRESDVKFAERHSEELTADKFFKTGSGFTEVYYNPDAEAGGQIVYTEISEENIKEAAQSKQPRGFFDRLAENGRCYLIDAGAPEFRGNLESFINRKADLEGCTKKTMDGLKKVIGITPKHKDMER